MAIVFECVIENVCSCLSFELGMMKVIPYDPSHEKLTLHLLWKPKPNRKPRFFLQNLPKPSDRKNFETVTPLFITQLFCRGKQIQNAIKFSELYYLSRLLTCTSHACPIEASITKIILSGFCNKQNLLYYSTSQAILVFGCYIDTVTKF